jgi:hypothetical protein
MRTCCREQRLAFARLQTAAPCMLLRQLDRRETASLEWRRSDGALQD